MSLITPDEQKAADAALLAKRGYTKVNELEDAARRLYVSMTAQELEKMSGRHYPAGVEIDSE
ncbi:DUF3008 family protein [Roseovarius sp.]|uniref:DUF3008 family protein n=1 Tax=Roseovarius sp. TaxID=1486281 RepID=UPI00262471F4|nr:DUF3008 family protein [Roseovarius sp.]MDM8167915.1 DUF3008 family protein [Roseovarius sp.]